MYGFRRRRYIVFAFEQRGPSLDPRAVRESGGYGLGMNTATRGLTTRPAYPT
jgi:hypothetical protein